MDGCERGVDFEGTPCGAPASMIEYCHRCEQARFLCAEHGSERNGELDHAIKTMLALVKDRGDGERLDPEDYERDGCKYTDVEIRPL